MDKDRPVTAELGDVGTRAKGLPTSAAHNHTAHVRVSIQLRHYFA